MVRSIIFDCFGVLAVDSWIPFKEEYFGDKPELFQKAGELNRLSDGGKITREHFLESIALLAELPQEEVINKIDSNPVNKQLFDYIKTLKKDYKIGLLSNAAGNWLGELFIPNQLELLDEISLSYESGYVKPNEGAYIDIAKKLGVDLSECVFVDDQESFCVAARKIGMLAICYKHFNQFKSDFESIVS